MKLLDFSKVDELVPEYAASEKKKTMIVIRHLKEFLKELIYFR